MERLLDGDLAANNGGWQWAASTGCDPQPYFRVFNPVLQGRKVDPDGDYVRAWLPERRGDDTRADPRAARRDRRSRGPEGACDSALPGRRGGLRRQILLARKVLLDDAAAVVEDLLELPAHEQSVGQVAERAERQLVFDTVADQCAARRIDELVQVPPARRARWPERL